MNNIEYNSTFLPLPGFQKIFFKRDQYKDILFFIVLLVIPGNFFSLVSMGNYIDMGVLTFLIAMPYLLLNIKYIKKIVRMPAGWAFLILNIFLIFQFLYSWFIQNIPFFEVATVFRVKFYIPIATMGLLLYAAGMDNRRLYRLFYWIVIASLLQGILVVFAVMTGLDIFSVHVKEELLIIEDFAIALFAQPIFNDLLYVFALITFLVANNRKPLILFWTVPLFLAFLGDSRGQQILYFLYAAFSIIFIRKIISTTKSIKKNFVIFLLIIFSLTAMFVIFPQKVDRLMDKYKIGGVGNGYAKQFTEAGTYAFRLKLIEEAYIRTEQNDNLLFGNGYIRASTPGSYDFVLGSDTHIPSVLFTEGIFGFVFRLTPIFILLFMNIKYFFFRQEKRYKLFSLAAIVLIFPHFAFYVQTNIYTAYSLYYLVLFMLELIKYNDKKQIKLTRKLHVT